MIGYPYSQLSPGQKEFVQKFLGNFLKEQELDSFYRVQTDGDHLFIRESKQNPPQSSHKKNLDNLIELENAKGLIFFKKRRPIVASPMNRPNIKITETLFEAVEINPNLMSLDNKPTGMNQKTWAIIPPEIKEYWGHFNNQLQQHIINCLAEKLDDRYDRLSTTRVLGNTYRSPIGLEAPKIPVRLPNAVLGQSNEIYDLMEILNLPAERNPDNNLAQRRNPITREFFDLNQIIPAPKALEELKRRANVHAPSPTPRP